MMPRRCHLATAGAIALALTASACPAADFDRTHPPALAPLTPPRLPAPQVQVLPNGLRLVVVEMHKVPVVDVAVLVRAGAAEDPATAPGLATFTADMLDEGAGARSATALAEAVDYLGASLTTGAGRELASVRLHCTKARLAAGLDLLADVVLRPAFADSEVARQRTQRQSSLLQLRDQPVAIAPLAFYAIVYGEHPYGHPTQGDEASAAALDRDAVRRFYRTWYVPGNATVLVTGDVTPAEAKQWVVARFGAWEGSTAAALPAPPPPAAAPARIYLVDKPGAAQSVVWIGLPGAPRSSPDFAALRVLNTLLGGSFTSRLNQNLRETHGYTYGASSDFDMSRLAGPFRASASVQTAKTDSALVEFLGELRRIRDEVVPDAELAKAKAYLQLGFPARFQTTQDATGMFADLVAADAPLEAWAGYSGALASVTAADVQRVARQWLDPARFAIVVVGDRATIEAPLAALGVAPIEHRDLWGHPAP